MINKKHNHKNTRNKFITAAKQYGLKGSPTNQQQPQPHLSTATSPTLGLPVASSSQRPESFLPRPGTIVKSYRSCPVSPVQDHCDWLGGGDGNSSARVGPTRHTTNRNPLYHEDAKQIMDSIHADTEKMIREITEKYGNLEEGKPNSKLLNKRVEELKYTAQKDKNEHGFLSEEEESNFSSDSLEDCSLNVADPGEGEKEKGENRKRRVCRKHPHKGGSSSSSTTKPVSPRARGGSTIEVMSQASSHHRLYDRSRNVSLSEILMDDQVIVEEERNRRDTVSGTGVEPKSEESLLSDDFSNDNLSYYNSMESIMSDESAECKSAPLDVVFGRQMQNQHQQNNPPYPKGGLDVTQEAVLSKSYGSSPNNCPGFDYYYMQNAYSMANNNKTSMSASNTCPKLAGEEEEVDFCGEDEIPSSQARMNQYRAAMNKSLREDFGAQRAARQCDNPLWQCEEVPVKFTREDIFGGGKLGPDLVNDCESGGGGSARATEQSFRKFEQNLQKFERDRSMFGHAGMQMDYVPHKPPMAGRRSTSMRARRRKNLSGKFNTMGNIDQFQEEEVMVIKSGDVEEDHGLIGLELSFNEPALNNSMDQLVMVVDLQKEGNEEEEDKLMTEQCNNFNVNETDGIGMPNEEDYANFNDIRSKIEIVQKLVAMEERKLEEAHRLKESRMRPFEANVRQKGYVKSLTMNFDNLAKGGFNGDLDGKGVEEEEMAGSSYSVPRELRVKRIKSVPELESVKFRSFHVLADESAAVFLPKRFYNDLSNSNKNNTNEQQQQEMSSQGARAEEPAFYFGCLLWL